MKKVVFIGLALALVAVMLLPSPTLAAKPVPFSTNGVIVSISDGTVKPAGGSGRFVVQEREIGGFFTSGDITGPFTFNYKANVELATQAGNLHGTLVVGDKVLNVNGTIQPLQMVPTPFGFDLPMLSIEGHWNFKKGAQGEGDFTAFAVFIPDEFGHVVLIPISGFQLTGQWQP